MTAYFDDLRQEMRDIPPCDPQEWVRQLGLIERRVVEEVQLVTGDREFPEDLRERILLVIATRAVYDLSPAVPARQEPVEYAATTKTSDLLETLHSLFHQLAARRVETRFGRLSDSPRAILNARNAYDQEH